MEEIIHVSSESNQTSSLTGLYGKRSKMLRQRS